MEANTALVDAKIRQGQYVVASKEQQVALAQFAQSRVKKHATFRGTSGCGKTLMMGRTLKIVVSRTGGKILFILLSGGWTVKLEHLHNYLVTGETRATQQSV